MGAEALIGKVAAELNTGSGKADPVAELKENVRKLITMPGDAPEKEAAETWVSLFRDYLAIPAGKRSGMASERPPFTLANVFEALPRPDAWDELSAQIAALPDGKQSLLRDSLELVDATLAGDAGKQLAAMEGMRKSYLEKNAGNTWAAQYTESYFKELKGRVDARGASPEGTIAALRKKIDVIGKGKAGARDSNYLELPALAGVIPDAEAMELIKDALLKVDIYSVSHEPTRRLVAKVMMGKPDAIEKPVWSVVETPAEIPLFEMLVDKFPKSDDWSFAEAEGNYVSALLGLREFGKARGYIEMRAEAGARIPFAYAVEGKDATLMAEAMDFFGKLLKDDPAHPYWESYLRLAEKAGQTSEAILELKSAMDSAQEGTDLIGDLRLRSIEALLEAGRVEEGFSFLRELVRKMEAEGAVTNEKQAGDHVSYAIRLAKMARLLERPEILDEAFAAAEDAVIRNRRFTDSGYQSTFDYVGELVRQGRGADAEETLADELVFMSRAAGESRRQRGEVMTALAYVYSEAGRHRDVVDLLEKGTMWDAADLADLARNSFNGKPLMLIAAEALHAVGRDDAAGDILDRVLAMHPGNDSAYTLLLEIGGKGISEKLDRLHAENRFEERPLVWKAKLLSDAGKLDEAEKAAKAAIAIDPSDGEQGKGDRMRVYAVLAEIMGKKGDREQQAFLNRVVSAIRLSEDGDDWWSAGMRKRAITIYEESLKQFADAYCIQSRLALRYSEMGDFGKAEEHFRRAFELMPESFGRVESHCFGCEGAFSGELAQSIAERVFLKLAEQMPDRAQVFYLLGYLREEQGRATDAAGFYGKAVEIDPDYINAWSKLKETAEEAGLGTEEKDGIALELYRLNPYGGSLSGISDLSKLWTAALEAEKSFVPDESGPVFALRASSRPEGQDHSYMYSHYQRKAPPRKQLTAQDEVSAMIRTIESLWRQ